MRKSSDRTNINENADVPENAEPEHNPELGRNTDSGQSVDWNQKLDPNRKTDPEQSVEQGAATGPETEADVKNDGSKKREGNLLFRLLTSEGMRYLFIGGCTTLVNLVVFTVLCRVVHLNVNVSNIISVAVAIVFAYVTNKLIVFRSHCSSFGELAAECARFIGARLATMVIEVGGVFVLYEIVHQDELIAKLETQVLVVIGNYFISRFIVFRDRKK